MSDVVSKLKTLKVKTVLELEPTAPFNFDATFHKPDHFPSTDCAWEPGIRWQAMRWQGRSLGLKFANQGTVKRPSLALEVWSARTLSPNFLEGLAGEIQYRYNLQLDLTEFNRRFSADPQLRPILKRWRGTRPMSPGSLYEYLIIAIVLQNATVRRSVQMLQALFENYGTRLAYDGLVFHCFWGPKDLAGVSEQDLRGLKVGYRAKSIHCVTRAFACEEINELELRGRPLAEQRAALLGLYGIGPASVGYILFDVFHHWDELNHISPWEQKIYSRLFFDTKPDTPVPVDRLLRRIQERFGGYRQLAVHYIWEDLFWRRKHEPVEWLERLIRL